MPKRRNSTSSVIPAQAGIQGKRRAVILGPRFRGYDEWVRSEEDRIDLAAVEVHRAYERAIGWATAGRSYLTRSEAEGLIEAITRKRGPQRGI